MTRDQMKQVIGIMTVNYPNAYKGYTKEQYTMLVDSWMSIFGDIPFEIMRTATINMICTADFPTAAALQKEVDALINPDYDGELWASLQKAIADSTYHCKEAFEKLPDVCKKFVGRPSVLKDMAMIDPATLGTVIRSNFMKSAPQIKHHEYVQKGLPMEVRNVIEQAKQNQLTYMEE